MAQDKPNRLHTETWGELNIDVALEVADENESLFRKFYLAALLTKERKNLDELSDILNHLKVAKEQFISARKVLAIRGVELRRTELLKLCEERLSSFLRLDPSEIWELAQIVCQFGFASLTSQLKVVLDHMRSKPRVFDQKGVIISTVEYTILVLTNQKKSLIEILRNRWSSEEKRNAAAFCLSCNPTSEETESLIKSLQIETKSNNSVVATTLVNGLFYNLQTETFDNLAASLIDVRMMSKISKGRLYSNWIDFVLESIYFMPYVTPKLQAITSEIASTAEKRLSTVAAVVAGRHKALRLKDFTRSSVSELAFAEEFIWESSVHCRLLGKP